LPKPTSLVIVESKAKAHTINGFLGDTYKVLSCFGHVRDLPPKELGVDLEKNYEPVYEISADKKTIAGLKKVAKDCETIYLATDPDREGEAISWHLQEILKPVNKDASMHRIMFNEITRDAISRAINSPGEIDMNKVYAQQARRIMDRLVGYQISPLLWRRVKQGLSAGRVQSVALRLICEREESIISFLPEEYWSLEAHFNTEGGHKVVAQLNTVDGQKVVDKAENLKRDDYFVIASKEEADLLTQRMAGKTATVEKITTTPKKKRPSPPYITSTLQQDASRRLGFTGNKTMRVAQSLYEGVALDDEATGLITYMRTDSVRVAEEAIEANREYIDKAYGKEYLHKDTRRFKVKKGAQDAHEAIRPTYVKLSPTELKKHLNKDQLALYTLIWQRFVATQMAECRQTASSIDLAMNGLMLRANGLVLEFDGFTKVYQIEHEDRLLPVVSEGEVLNTDEIASKQHFTRPPARFNDASLIKELEERDIGRPSTYASIIQVLLDKKYILKETGSFRRTDLGEITDAVLRKAFPKEVQVKFTAHMEEELDNIEGGGIKWQETLDEFYQGEGNFKNAIETAADKIHEAVTELETETEMKCAACESTMRIKWGKNGFFLACPGYPECRETRNISHPLKVEPVLSEERCPNDGHKLVRRWDRYRYIFTCPLGDFSRPLTDEESEALFEKREEIVPEETDEVCEKCGSPMLLRTFKGSRFLACSAYPKCKNTLGISIGIKCPKEGCEGDLTERRSRYGKMFYGCNKYPDCDFIAWNKPIVEPCPECGATYLVEKNTKRDGPHVACAQKTCKYKRPLVPTESE
jgi:DNA topoisomerase I